MVEEEEEEQENEEERTSNYAKLLLPDERLDYLIYVSQTSLKLKMMGNFSAQHIF
jgi:hypothetical protein